MRSDQLDVTLPMQIAVAVNRSRVQFMAFWTDQARIAELEWRSKQPKSPLIRGLRG